MAELVLPTSRYESTERQAAFFGQLLERLTAQLDSGEAVVASNLPLRDANMYMVFGIPGRPGTSDGDEYVVNVTGVSAGYFSVLQIPMRHGRSFLAEESETDAVVVSESLARRHFQGRNPVGEQISIMGRDRTIIGVAADVRQNGIRLAGGQQLYLPFRQIPRSRMFVVTRPTAGHQAVAPMLRGVVSQIDSEQPISSVREFKDVIGASLASDRLLLYLVGAFSSVAVVLATVGVYGVIAYWVAQHSREIGIRLALGARPADVSRPIFCQAGVLAVIGAAIGAFLAFALSTVLGSIVFGFARYDPTSMIVAGLIPLVVAVAAAWLPARRAASVDPMVALRYE